MASNVLKGSPIILDLSPNGGGQLQISNNTNDDKIFLEGFSRDGNGHASEMLVTGRFAQRLPLFSVLADTTRLIGSAIVLDLSPNGGGQLQIRSNIDDNKIFLEGFGRDGNGHAAEMLITGSSAQRLPLFSVLANTTRLLGDVEVTGDIRLTNADCAEDFNVGTDLLVEPGTVMVLGDAGALFPSQHAYDKRVAGVVSGAGDYKPGIVLDKQQSESKRQPIALVGKVYCKVDAQYGAIAVGDLLTTSPTPGHAMKAEDPVKAFGAVIGKTLRPLAEGQGLIPILIALQ